MYGLELQSAPKKLHLLHDALQLDYSTVQIHVHVGYTPLDALKVTDHHRHTKFATSDEMEAAMCITALRVLLEKNVKATREGRSGRVRVHAVDGGENAMNLILFRRFGNGNGKDGIEVCHVLDELGDSIRCTSIRKTRQSV